MTRLALDHVDEMLKEKRRLTAQQTTERTAAPVFVVPAHPTLRAPKKREMGYPISSCRFSIGAATNSAEFIADHQHSFILPPAYLSPMLSSYTHLQTHNARPIFLSQPLDGSSPISTTLDFSSVVPWIFFIPSNKSSINLDQETFEANVDASGSFRLMDRCRRLK